MAGPVFVFLLTAAAWGHGRSKPALPASSEPGYVQALAAANRFLYAWQTGDLANGMALLSDGIRHAQSAGAIEQFFSAGTDRAFEIGAGSGHRGRYSFPVVLMSVRAAEASAQSSVGKSVSRKFVTRRSSEIVLVNTGKDDWVVDKLP